MSFDIEIREARPENAKDIAKIHIKSWRHAYKGIVHQSYLESGLDLADREKRWQENLSAGGKGTFLAFTGSKLLGFSTVGKSRSDQYPDYYELYAIYLDPDYIGRGIGKTLFQHCLRHVVMQGGTKIFLNVFCDNIIGRNFYERLGGAPISQSEKELTIDGHKYWEMKYEWVNI